MPITPPAEYKMMSRKITPERNTFAYDAEQDEYVGDHHSGE